VAIDCNISIIIVSFNCLGPLKDCLNSIKAQGNVNFETIIVDNDSQDGTPDFLKDQKDVRAVFPGKNIGFGAAVNLAAKQARGQYLFILNPDTLLPSNCLASLLEFANSHPDSGLIAPILSHTDGSYQISARKFPRRCDLIFGRGSPLFKLGLVREKDAGYYSSIGERPLQVPAVSATATIIRTELFRDLGGFDERFFMYLEDLDLCRRISERALPIWILPSVKITHAWRQSSATRPYFALFHHHLSVYKYFKKHYSKQWYYNFSLGPALMAGFVLSAGLTALRSGDRS
jgi:N-acetylglucosaminyl-diphospho-decaprenol L-rhamnosyltransferase